MNDIGPPGEMLRKALSLALFFTREKNSKPTSKKIPVEKGHPTVRFADKIKPGGIAGTNVVKLKIQIILLVFNYYIGNYYC